MIEEDDLRKGHGRVYGSGQRGGSGAESVRETIMPKVSISLPKG